jgi:hypothetical protein
MTYMAMFEADQLQGLSGEGKSLKILLMVHLLSILLFGLTQILLKLLKGFG